MTAAHENHTPAPAWAARARLRDVYLDALRYERGNVPVPADGPGMLAVRLHATDESARTDAGKAGEGGGSHLHLRLELTLHGIPAGEEPAPGEERHETVFEATLVYRAEYELAALQQLPPEEERGQFISQVAIPGLWLQMRQMADMVTSQTRAGRVLLPAAPPPLSRQPS
ncbi:hypothetical protein [Alkalilimnicola ehrlichii]|uniref:hypothetical protein n=1 Tax=Alkalilimnicola ehrlichii TaxID=351052 RepID=UPI003B9F649A